MGIGHLRLMKDTEEKPNLAKLVTRFMDQELHKMGQVAGRDYKWTTINCNRAEDAKSDCT